MDIDTIKLRIFIKFPSNNPYFSEKKFHKKVYFKVKDKDGQYRYVAEDRFYWTNNKWRKQQKETGLYVPNYRIEQDFINPNKYYFLFEASAQKLLRGHNIGDFKNDDLKFLAEKIVNFCKQIEIKIFTRQILNAKPTLLAIGENISLTDLCSCDLALETLVPFNYKPHAQHRITHFNDYKGGGKELYFNIKKTETTKFYDKKRDIINRAKTREEKERAEIFKQPNNVFEIFRIERTFKTPRKISEKFAPYLNGKPPTLKNLFKTEIWEALLKDEVNKILNQPLQNFIFLSTEQQPFIDAFLNKHFKHTQVKNNVRGIIDDLQKFGLANTRRRYLKCFDSRQTWYNYQKRLIELSKQIDYKSLANLENFKIHQFILKHFGIDNTCQQKLNLNFKRQCPKK